MSNLDTLPSLTQTVKIHRLGANKKLGQHFLLDMNVTDQIARLALPLDGHHIVEIGPGPGGLTRALLMEGADHVIAIERDARCLEALAQIAEAYPGRLSVIEADALTVHEPDLIPPEHQGKPVRIVSNLPYNVATPIISDSAGSLPKIARRATSARAPRARKS